MCKPNGDGKYYAQCVSSAGGAACGAAPLQPVMNMPSTAVKSDFQHVPLVGERIVVPSYAKAAGLILVLMACAGLVARATRSTCRRAPAAPDGFESLCKQPSFIDEDKNQVA